MGFGGFRDMVSVMMGQPWFRSQTISDYLLTAAFRQPLCRWIILPDHRVGMSSL